MIVGPACVESGSFAVMLVYGVGNEFVGNEFVTIS